MTLCSVVVLLPSAAVVLSLLDAGTVVSCDAFGVGVWAVAWRLGVLPLVAPGAGLVVPLAGERGGAVLGLLAL